MPSISWTLRTSNVPKENGRQLIIVTKKKNELTVTIILHGEAQRVRKEINCDPKEFLTQPTLCETNPLVAFDMIPKYTLRFPRKMMSESGRKL